MPTIKHRQVDGSYIKVMDQKHVEKLRREPKHAQNRHARRTQKALERGQAMADLKWKTEKRRLEENKLRQMNMRAKIEKRQNAKRAK